MSKKPQSLEPDQLILARVDWNVRLEVVASATLVWVLLALEGLLGEMSFSVAVKVRLIREGLTAIVASERSCACE